MKPLLLAMFGLMIFASSCTKCYECSSSNASEKICKGDARFDAVKNGQSVTDYNGEAYICQ